MTETASACCYLCNECDSTFASLEELENHMTGTHADGNQEDTVAAAADKCADDDEDEAGFGSSNHEDMDTTPHGMDQSAIQDHSPSSSDTSNYDHSSDPSMLGADGGFDPSLSNGSHDGKSYPCRFCSKVFEGRSQLNIHYTHTHRDKPQYECEVCHQVYSVKRELSTHMRIHSGEQPHKCTQCGKEFGTRQLLKKHWMWHTGERSHVCPHCGKAFFQKGHLTQHLMIHAGGRPHQCNLCQKTFIFKFDLNRHMKIHAERGYSCEKCGRAFLKQSSLEEHIIKCRSVSKSLNSGGSPSGTPFSDVKSESSSTAATPQPADDSPAASTPSATAGAQQQFFCFFCMRQFGSQAAYTLHLSYVHFRNGVLNPNPQPPTNGDASDEQKVSPSSIPSSGIFGQPLQSQQIDNSHPETQGNRSSFQEAANHESTANSSSSHKSILSSQTPLSIDSGSNCSSCDMCTLLRKRTAELERALTVRDSEIMRLNESMRRVGGIAGNLLESCTDFDKLWMLHSKKVYTQIQSVLCSIE